MNTKRPRGVRPEMWERIQSYEGAFFLPKWFRDLKPREINEFSKHRIALKNRQRFARFQLAALHILPAQSAQLLAMIAFRLWLNIGHKALVARFRHDDDLKRLLVVVGWVPVWNTIYYQEQRFDSEVWRAWLVVLDETDTVLARAMEQRLIALGKL